MGFVPERRKRSGRRSTDRAVQALHGVLHDIGHEITTLNYLVESILSEVSLPLPVRRRALLIEQQTERLQTLIRRTVFGEMLCETVALRPLLEQLVAQADLSNETRVELVPGPSVTLDVDRTALWRILSNLLGNAIRAAGPTGHVDVLIKATAPVTIEITDDGPGFDGRPVGAGSLGLSTVAQLTSEYGAETVVRTRDPRGTQVEIIFPAGSAEVEGRDG